MQSETDSRRDTEIEPQLPKESEIEKEANHHTNFVGGIFRIAKAERPMFFRMASMFFIIAFIYSVMRNAKDAFVLNNQEQASMMFLKYAIIFVSIFAVVIVQYLISLSSISQVMLGVIVGYMVFFLVFGFFLYPYPNLVQLNEFFSVDKFGDDILAVRGLAVLYAIILTFNFWTTSIFYICSEIWGNLVLSLLFLSFANEVLTFKQTLRFVPLFYIASNIGLFFSGVMMYLVGYVNENCRYAINKHAIKAIFIILMLSGMVYMLIHLSLTRTILKKKIFVPEGEKKKKSKKRVGMAEGLSHCFKSKLLLNFCFIVLAYNVTVNIIDSVFKQVMKVKGIYDNVAIDSFTMTTEAANQIFTAIIVIVALMTPLSRLVQTIGWFFTGMVAPSLSAITSVAALVLSIMNTSSDGTHGLKLMNNLFKDKISKESQIFYINLEFWISRFSSVLFKVTKYAFFDVAKESLSMRINSDMRSTYKAVYDGVVGKLGKAANGVISSILFTLTNTNKIRDITIFLFVVSGLLFTLWIYGVWYLSQKYEASVASNTDIDLDYFAASKDKNAELGVSN